MAKNKNVFITSDVWFNRPMGDFSSMTNSEYNNMVIDNWNNVVNKKDVVYVLGGFGIGDCYDKVIKLNGEIHFLNSVFSKSDSDFRNSMEDAVEHSVDKELKKRIIFERNQILALPKEDCILSYFPLNDWFGKSTDTFCFHGYSNDHNICENNISCKFELWKDAPVCIKDIKNYILKFEKIFQNNFDF